MVSLDDIKGRYCIETAWRDLGLPGRPGRCVSSPFRRDRRASLSIYANGQRWRDHATAEGGDVFDFVARARECSTADAIAFVRARLGVEDSHPRPTRASRSARNRGPRVPALRRGTEAEVRTLAEQRGFDPEALRLAESRGLLRFGELFGGPAWCVTDQRGQLFEFRRLDGRPWPATGRLSKRKAHGIGSGKSWPVGTLESVPFECVAWAEGAPDLLAAFHHLLVEGREEAVAPVAVLGAANHRLAPDALTHFRGKQVTIYPHVDEAGRKACRAWARQLRDAGAGRVVAFDLSGLVRDDGSPGKDLADVARIDVDCWEGDAKWRRLMP